MGKSSSITIGYWYYVAFHHGLTLGPVDALLAMAGAKKIAWEGELTESGAININNPNLWGGEKDQGGMVGTLRLMMGEADQEPNAYLTSVFGEQTTSWRGFCTVAWEGGKYGAMNPWPQKPSYKIRTIKAMWDDGECWYPEKAAVLMATSSALNLVLVLDQSGSMLDEVSPGVTRMDLQKQGVVEAIEELAPALLGSSGTLGVVGFGRMVGDAGSTPEPRSYHIDSVTSPAQIQAVIDFVNALDCVVYSDTDYAVGMQAAADIFAASGSPLAPRVVFCTDGVPTRVTGGTSQTVTNDAIAARNSITGGCVVRCINIDLPDTTYTSQLDNFGGAVPIVDSSNDGEIKQAILDAIEVTGSYAMNPVHMLIYSRTQRDLGREPIANINAASAEAAADWYYSNGFGLCTKRPAASESPSAFERRIQQVAGCSFTRSLADGQWYVDIANGEYDLESLPILTDDDVLEFRETPAVLDEAVNSVSVRYFDVATRQFVTTPPIRAMGLIAAFGENHKTYDHPEIPTSAMALRVAARYLTDSTTPTRVFDLSTTRATYAWRPNQYFRAQLPKRGIADTVCLVGQIQHGQLRSGAIKLQATLEPAALPNTVYTKPEPGVDTRPSQVALPIVAQRAFEAPYYNIVSAMSRADLVVLPEETGFLLGVAVDPASSRDFTLSVAPSGGDYEQVASGEFCPTALVVEAADKQTEDFTFTDGAKLHFVAVGAPVLWDDEIGRVKAIDALAGTISIGRGCADTVAQLHAAGSRLYFYGDAAAADRTEYSDGESVDVKLLTNTGSQQLDESLATPITVTFDQRQFRPYPPARLRFADSVDSDLAYPEELVGAITVSWAHRDRGLQADQLLDTDAASVGPEAGVTYEVAYEQPPGSSVATESGISGDAATPYSFPVSGAARVLVTAIRDGLTSWQSASHDFDWVSASPTAGYLDGLAVLPTAVWSLRKMVSTATVAIRVRRSSDNAEQDIGFSGGDLDTSALAAFVGSDSAYVRTFYDQTGGGFDAEQATAGNQARIVNAGTFDGEAVFDGSNDHYVVSSLTVGTPQLQAYLRCSATYVAATRMFFELTADYAGTPGGGALFYSNSYMRMGCSNPGSPTQRRHNEFSGATPAGMTTLSVLWDRSISGQGEAALWVNGVAQTVTASPTPVEQTGNFPTASFNIGARSAGTLANPMRLETLAVYAASTTSIRADIEGVVEP